MPHGLACSAPSSLLRSRFAPLPTTPASVLVISPAIRRRQPYPVPATRLAAVASALIDSSVFCAPDAAQRHSVRHLPTSTRNGILELLGAADLFCRPQGPKQGAFSAPSAPPPPLHLSENATTSRQTERVRRAKGEKLGRTIPRCRQYSNLRISSAMVGPSLLLSRDARNAARRCRRWLVVHGIPSRAARRMVLRSGR